jgi:Tol biopolymer transport system component
LALCLCALVLAPSAPATFPGQNGKIAFVHTKRGELGSIYTMRRDGSHERRIVGIAEAPAYSANGRKLLFVDSRNSQPYSLYMSRADGSKRRRIPHTRHASDGSFAPSGRRVAFTRFRPPYDESHIYTVRVDGSGRRRLTRGAGGSAPAFSPNGKWIAFRKLCEIGLMRANGRRQRLLTDSGRCETSPDFSSPAFSPSGRKIVFGRYERGAPRRSGIYTIMKDGTHLKPVYEATNEVIGDPVFSPDGRKIAFSRRSFSWTYKRIYTIRPDGSHLRRLSHSSAGHEQLSWAVRR